MAATLLTAAALAVQLVGSSIADRLGATSVSPFFIDDAWTLAIIVILLATWAYHAWIRARDLRQGTFIGGAAAWFSRLYLYGAAFVGLVGVLNALSSIIATVAAVFVANKEAGPFGMDPYAYLALVQNPSNWWLRPIVAAIVAIAVWGAIWLSHWLYSNRLRSGADLAGQSAAERASKVRVAFFAAVVAFGVFSVVTGLAGTVEEIFDGSLGVQTTLVPVWYLELVPPAMAVPAGIAWWWHRRRALSEEPEGPAGVSARRVVGYVTALVGMFAIADGAAAALAALFGHWFVTPIVSPDGETLADDLWKFGFASGAGLLVAGAAIWIVPWLSSNHRRATDKAIEIGSAARSYFLYVVLGSAVLAGAITLAMILYRYCRVGFGLPETDLPSEVSTPLAVLVVAAILLAYHGWVLRLDRAALARPDDGSPTDGSPAAAS
jgi:hypothetical protein